MIAGRRSSLTMFFFAMDHFEFIGSESCQFTPKRSIQTTNDQPFRQNAYSNRATKL